jgi:hydroxymethylpyrimidine pyrophosphatase-like HAD family hydrolase
VQVGDVSYTNEPYSRRADSCATDFGTFTARDAEKLVIATACDTELARIASENSLGLFSYFGGEYKRLNALGATKAEAMLALIDMNGEDVGKTIAFGDDFGDIDMMLAAAHGVVMKNASSAVRERIPNVTDYTNAEDGVARYLVKYFGIEEYFPYPTTL